ncbi:MAG TPA: type II secretion system F family protein [Solirubrobacterales bacterium]|jgi:type IV pilus assembly protein PilC|nr:type II secretion system F family protein [Solirubrobacterales bacterium]
MSAATTTFAFKAMDLTGTASAGELDADSKAQVSEQLRQRGLIVLDVSEKKAPFNIEDLFKRFQGVDMRALSVFSRQFATLVASGMPMLRTLHTLEEQTQEEQIKAAVGSVRADVEAGSTLEQGMERHPKVFDRLFRAMVRSGEQSGRLEDALDRIAFQVEKADILKRQVKSALMYPALVFSVAVIVLVAIVAFVIPVFVKIFEELAAEHPDEKSGLPVPTQICVTASEAITGYWFLILPSIALLIVGFVKLKKTKIGHEYWDRAKLRIPFKIGDVIQKVALARWSRTFSGSVSAGVPMLQAIQLTGETAGNVVVEQAMQDVYESVKRGGSLAAPIQANPIFPPMVGHMIAVGEETGQLEHMLTKIADFYEAEVDAKVKALTALIEPLMIVFVGGMVGFIVIAMYLPMFSIYEKIR